MRRAGDRPARILIRIPGSITPGSHTHRHDSRPISRHPTKCFFLLLPASSIGRQHIYLGSIDLARRFGGSTSGGPTIQGRQSRNGRSLSSGVNCNCITAPELHTEVFQWGHGLRACATIAHSASSSHMGFMCSSLGVWPLAFLAGFASCIICSRLLDLARSALRSNVFSSHVPYLILIWYPPYSLPAIIGSLLYKSHV